MEFERVKEAFRIHGKADRYFEYEDEYNKLSGRIEPFCRAYPGEDFGEPQRIRQNSLTYRQVLLHRAILLFEGSLYALVENNPYSMALSIRAHFETTAALGYLHNRLNSLRNGNIKAEVMDQDLCAQLLGSRDERLSEAPEAKQILSMLEYADKSISKHILDGTGRQYEILSDCYKFLCEFSHPNFHSNSVAIDVDKSVPAFKFRYGKIMRNQEFNLIGYLLLSTPLFIEVFDSLVELLPEEKNLPIKSI